MVLAYNDYREFLKQVLLSRQEKNSRYSLRAFAKSLSISPGALSKVLNSVNNLSHQKALDFSKVLNMNETETNYFLHLVTMNNLTRRLERTQGTPVVELEVLSH